MESGCHVNTTLINIGCAWQMEIWNIFMYSQGQLKRNIGHKFVQTYVQMKYILKQSKPSIILSYSKK